MCRNMQVDRWQQRMLKWNRLFKNARTAVTPDMGARERQAEHKSELKTRYLGEQRQRN